MNKIKGPFLFTFVLPVAYVVAQVLILTGRLGGDERGFGAGPFLDVSMPAGLLGFLVAWVFRAEWMLVPVCFAAALGQYAFIGYLIDRLRSRRYRRKQAKGR